jgi:hypothetical protein
MLKTTRQYKEGIKMMRPPNTKKAIKLTVDIRPGPASPVQQQTWQRFWLSLIAQAKSKEAK